jgi:hypothetical protein
MTTRVRRILLKRRTWTFIPVLFLLLSVASDGFPEVLKTDTRDIVPVVLEVLAQGDPQKGVHEEKSRTPRETSPGDLGKKAVPEKPKERSPSFEDFVPSEKIDADKAVDFPVDI